MTWPLVLCIAIVAASGGFAMGWRQCDEENKRKALLQEGWQRIRENAIRDGILDKDGRSVTEPTA